MFPRTYDTFSIYDKDSLFIGDADFHKNCTNIYIKRCKRRKSVYCETVYWNFYWNIW